MILVALLYLWEVVPQNERYRSKVVLLFMQPPSEGVDAVAIDVTASLLPH